MASLLGGCYVVHLYVQSGLHASTLQTASVLTFTVIDLEWNCGMSLFVSTAQTRHKVGKEKTYILSSNLTATEFASFRFNFATHFS